MTYEDMMRVCNFRRSVAKVTAIEDGKAVAIKFDRTGARVRRFPRLPRLPVAASNEDNDG